MGDDNEKRSDTEANNDRNKEDNSATDNNTTLNIDLGLVEENQIAIPVESRKFIGGIQYIITSRAAHQIYSFKKIGTRGINEITKQVNEATKHTRTNNIAKTNNLVNATSMR